MNRFPTALLLSALALAPAAHADTVFNFSGFLETSKLGDSTGDYDHGNTLSGTLTLSSDGTAFSAVNMTYQFNTAKGDTVAHNQPITFKTVGATFQDGTGIVGVHIIGQGNSFNFNEVIDIPTSNLAAYTGGAACGIFTINCGSKDSSGNISNTFTGLYGASSLDFGTLTLATPPPTPPTSTTPEPAGLTLLGTGALSFASLLRRRRA